MRKELCLMYVGNNEELINVQPVRTLPFDCTLKAFMETQQMLSLGCYTVKVGFHTTKTSSKDSKSYIEYKNNHMLH